MMTNKNMLLINDERDILKRFKDIKCIIHVGGCHCQEFVNYKKHKTKSLFIEPIPEMVTYAKNKYRGIDVIQCAATDIDGKNVDFHITKRNNIGASSLLELKDSKRLFPEVEIDHKISVKTRTIDSIVNQIWWPPNLLVMDTQGSEGAVLRGAHRTLHSRQLRYIFIEVNFSEVYEGCSLWQDIKSYLESHGFRQIGRDEWFQQNICQKEGLGFNS